MEPPEGSSTVDLAWRFFKAGILDLRYRHGAVARQLAHLAFDLEADAAFRQDGRGEGDADAEFLKGYARLSVGIHDRDWELATGEKFRGLARYRREVGLCQCPREAVCARVHALPCGS